MSLWQKWKDKRSVKNTFRKMQKAAFPGGEEQIDAEAGQLFALLNRKVSLDEARKILIHAKGRILIGFSASREEDVTQEDIVTRIVNSIRIHSEGRLDWEEAEKVYLLVQRKLLGGFATQGFIEGNSSSSDKVQSREPDEIVTITAKTAAQGIPMEYAWLENRYGKENDDWKVLDRVHGNSTDGNAYEIFTIATKKQGNLVIAFEISSFYGK